MSRPLPEVMQALKRDRKTGALEVTYGDRTARLSYLFGHLFHAESGEMEGEAALQEALGWPNVTTTFDEKAKLTTKESITEAH